MSPTEELINDEVFWLRIILIILNLLCTYLILQNENLFAKLKCL